MPKKAVIAEDIQMIAGAAVDAVVLVASVVEEYGPRLAYVAADAGKVLARVAGGGSRIIASGAKKALHNAKDARASKAEKKASVKAREMTVKASSQQFDARVFLEAYDAAQSVASAGGNYLSTPGCYAILLMPSLREKNLVKFKEVYVGSAEILGDAVYEHLSGGGNPDVYADVKYRRPVKVLLYQCDYSKLEEISTSLMMNLNAFSSYNARDIWW